MTAVPNWDIVGPSGSDAELARASAAGDRMVFADIYDRYADRLHDFCAGMLSDRDGAADVTRRCAGSANVGAKRHPMSCPMRHRVSPDRTPWPPAPNSPI